MQAPAYGALPGETGSIFIPGKRHRINLLAICINVFMPWLVFCCIYLCMSFSFHYHSPSWVFGVCCCGFLMVLGAAFLSYRTRKRDRDPMWYQFSTLMLLIAVVLSIVCGDMNYWYFMQPYYDIVGLNTYASVNPATAKGQQLMDAGRAYFSDGAQLDLKRTMGFQNIDLYCVAPIVLGSEPLYSYDFWAVGLNCCSGVSSDFRCGEFNNPHARSGLRLMNEEQRPFFRLAVQMAQAAYKIQANHPLFFYWMQDPVAEVNSYRERGVDFYLLGVMTFFAFNFFCVIVATIGFSKIGRY